VPLRRCAPRGVHRCEVRRRRGRAPSRRPETPACRASHRERSGTFRSGGDSGLAGESGGWLGGTAVRIAHRSPTGPRTLGSAIMTAGPSRAARAAIAAIEGYRHMVSPLRPPTCRFMPTCSQYAADALAEYGLLRGGRLAAGRLLKCGPWHHGGWDPIPERCGAGDGSEPERSSEATPESTQELRSANV